MIAIILLLLSPILAIHATPRTGVTREPCTFKTTMIIQHRQQLMSEHQYSQYGLLNSPVCRKQMRNGKMKTRTVAIVDYTAIDVQEDIMDQIL